MCKPMGEISPGPKKSVIQNLTVPEGNGDGPNCIPCFRFIAEALTPRVILFGNWGASPVGGCSCWSRPRFSEQRAHTRPLESWSAHRAWLGGAWTVHRDPTPRPRRCLACRPDFPARSPHSLSRVLCSGRRSPRPGRSPDPAHVPSLPRLPPCHSLHLQCPPLPTLLNKSYPCPKAQRGAVSPTKPL